VSARIGAKKLTKAGFINNASRQLSTPARVASFNYYTPEHAWRRRYDVAPREGRSRRRHGVLFLDSAASPPIPHRRRHLDIAAGNRRPVALHHLFVDAPPAPIRTTNGRCSKNAEVCGLRSIERWLPTLHTSNRR